MPAKKYFHEDEKPVFILGRLHQNDIENLHILVKYKHPEFMFNTLAELNDRYFSEFITQQPWLSKDFKWSGPKAVLTTIKEDEGVAFEPTGFSQHRFQFSPEMGKAVACCRATLDVNQSVFLHSATTWFLNTAQVRNLIFSFEKMRRSSRYTGTEPSFADETPKNQSLPDLIRMAQMAVTEAEQNAEEKRANLARLEASASMPEKQKQRGFARHR